MSIADRVYDTYEIRRAARQVDTVAKSVNSVQATDLARIQNELDGAFEGDAADALRELIGLLKTDVRTLANELEGISTGLSRYADRLEAADQAIAAIISG